MTPAPDAGDLALDQATALDVDVATDLCGAVWLYWPGGGQRKLVFDAPGWTLAPWREENPLTEPDDLDDVPPYSTDLHAAHGAEEAALGRGWGELYNTHLEAEVWRAGGEHPRDSWRHALAVRRAPAELRCRALLLAARDGRRLEAQECLL